MEFVPEVTAYLENKPGRLAKICSALAQEKVDIRALSVMETEGPSVLRFITTDLEATKTVLTKLGTEFRLSEVLAVPLENRTGSLARVLERLAEEHINVEYAYASTMSATGKALGIFHTSNPKRALKVLSESRTANQLVLRVEGPAATLHRLFVRLNGPAARNLKVEGASLQAVSLVVEFPPAVSNGYQEKTVTLRW